jgi:hypothetical protein
MSLYTRLIEIVPHDHPVIRHWGYYLVDKVIHRLPNRDFIKITNERLSKNTMNILFKPGRGSIRLYAFRIAFVRVFKYLFRDIVALFRDLFQILGKLISTLLP